MEEDVVYRDIDEVDSELALVSYVTRHITSCF